MMSELSSLEGRQSLRRQLLSGACIASLLLISTLPANAESGDKPSVWIEVGADLSRWKQDTASFLPPFTQQAAQHGLYGPEAVETPPNYGFGEEGSLIFQPNGSDWYFSAAVKYGRTQSRKHSYEQLNAVYYVLHNVGATQYPNRNGHSAGGEFQTANGHIIHAAVPQVDYSASVHEQKTLIDFQVGKDVGLGLFGRNSQSQIEFGVRFAQFASKTNLKLYADPYPHMYGKKYIPFISGNIYTNVYDQFYKAAPVLSKSFRGVGPTLSFKESDRVADVGEDAAIAIDWGVNFGLLFGRQKTHLHHQTTGTRWEQHFVPSLSYSTNQYVHTTNVNRSRLVTVPNIGASMGASFSLPNAKVSMGYRADFFFGAMDDGTDIRHASNIGFHGPYASVSIGLGG